MNPHTGPESSAELGMTIGKFHAIRRGIANQYNIPVIDTVLGDGTTGGHSGASMTSDDEIKRQNYIK